MRRKIVLDILIIVFAVIFIVSIANFASAESGQGDNNIVDGNNVVESSNDSSEQEIFDLSKNIKGDLDGDGLIKASDASRVLIYSAKMGVEYVKPSNQELNIADINGDDVINASDAALILIFAAKQGAAGPGQVITWDDVLNEI